MKTHPFQGWPIVAWAAIAVAGMVTVILATNGITEAGIHVVLRATARTSVALFLSAFAASPLHTVWRTEFSKWLRANRRYLGVSFAVSHLTHGLGIITLWIITSGTALAQRNPLVLVGGGFVFLLILAMAATSFDRTARWLGPRPWRCLHTFGMYLLWTIFTLAYVGRAVQSVAYVPLAFLLILAISLRLMAGFSRKSQKTTSGLSPVQPN